MTAARFNDLNYRALGGGEWLEKRDWLQLHLQGDGRVPGHMFPPKNAAPCLHL